MKKIFTLVLLLAASIQTFAQYQTGHRSISYTDPARANRSVPVEVYYPATTGGEDVTVAPGSFPLIVFGHGFLMSYTAYAYWKDQLVPTGYIVVFPTTEGSSPDHAAFGADLAFLINKVQSEGANAASPFYQRVDTTSAIMGHSMGGGASFLACENNTVPTCMITFAAANTDPSSITAAQYVTIPALVIAGEDDCVASPAANQQLMYNALASTCKVFVGIINGAHCYFADYNFTCTTGESFCNPVPSIDRADQLATSLKFTLNFLNYQLKGTGTWAAFLDSLSQDAAINYQIACSTTSIPDQTAIAGNLGVFPNPANSSLEIVLPEGLTGSYSIRLTNLLGQTMLQWNGTREPGSANLNVDVRSLARGCYQVTLETPSFRTFHSKLILQ